ncbi:MAG: histidinol-phosphatase HisJ family protein [Gaiellaceae bacterium]
MIVDYHMHLRDPSEDESSRRYTVTRAEQYVEQAGKAAVDEIGFSDHIYYFRQTKGFWEIPWMLERCTDDLDDYVDAVEEAKSRGLPVKLGLEVDYFPGIEPELLALLDPYPWDYLIGSVHFVDGFPVDQEPGLVHKLPPGEAWRRYFVWVRNAARSGLFDVLAHPDLVKIFGVRIPPDELHYLHLETADAIEAADVCVEVSAAGLHKPVGEIYPDRLLLAACRERGVPITLASDAHEPEDVGRDIDRAAALAREVGYWTVTVFDQRKRRQEPLG